MTNPAYSYLSAIAEVPAVAIISLFSPLSRDVRVFSFLRGLYRMAFAVCCDFVVHFFLFAKQTFFELTWAHVNAQYKFRG